MIAAIRPIVALMFLGLAVIANARIISVDNDGPAEFTTIQAAVDQAEDGDTVEIRPGTYTGAGNWDIEVRGKAITIRSIDPNDPCAVDATVIDCNDPQKIPHRAFYLIGQTPEIILAGLTITDGQGELNGGGVKCLGFVTLYRCHILDCSASRGGGAFCSGLWEDESVDCPSGGDGAVVRILECRIETNRAHDGGGVYASSDHVLVRGCELTRNRADNNGGGIACSFTVADLENNAVRGNTAREGGGIWLHETAATVADSWFAGNRAARYGGALCVRNTSYLGTPRFTLRGSTVVGNEAWEKTGGLFLQDVDPRECPEGYGFVSTSLLWRNGDRTGFGDVAQICGNRVQVHYCCIQDDDPNDETIPFDDGQDGHNIDDDPLLARWPDHGGDGWGDILDTPEVDEGRNDDFGDLHLRPESPCIQAGDPMALVASRAVDMDGQPRRMEGIVDIGADERARLQITILHPRGGQLLIGGTTQTIAWEGHSSAESFCLDFSTDAGRSWQILNDNVSPTGSLSWRVPQTIRSDACLIRIAPTSPQYALFGASTSSFFSIYPAALDPDIASRWRTLGGNFQRTGRGRDPGPKLGCIQWQFDTPAIIAGGAVIGWNGRIHVATYDGRVCTLDADGRFLWACDIYDAILEAPTVGDDGTVYVGSQSDGLHEIAPDGRLRRSYHVGPMAGAPAILPDGRLIAAANVVNLCEGKIWSFWVPSYGLSFASPAVGLDGTVYVTAWDRPSLCAFEPDSLSPKWGVPSGSEGQPFAGPVVGENGLVYQTFLDDSHLYAIDAKTGSAVWATDLADPCVATWDRDLLGMESWSEPVVGPDGTIYAGLDDPFVRAVDPNGGRIKWVAQLGSARSFTLAVDSQGYLYAASDDGCLYVVDDQGRQVGRFESDTPLNYPVIVSEGLLLVNGVKGAGLDSARGVLYAIAADPACTAPDLRPPEDRPPPRRR
jgi:outer membrane protein assembly factor BamB